MNRSSVLVNKEKLEAKVQEMFADFERDNEVYIRSVAIVGQDVNAFEDRYALRRVSIGVERMPGRFAHD